VIDVIPLLGELACVIITPAVKSKIALILLIAASGIVYPDTVIVFATLSSVAVPQKFDSV
jgi:hypothetical protein